MLSNTHDIDYLAFVPVGDEPPVARPENQSAPVHLVAGQRYYLEVLMKEWYANDHLAVTWQMPNQPAPQKAPSRSQANSCRH